MVLFLGSIPKQQLASSSHSCINSGCLALNVDVLKKAFAEELEIASKSNNIELIKEKHQRLINDYLSFKDSLSMFDWDEMERLLDNH